MPISIPKITVPAKTADSVYYTSVSIQAPPGKPINVTAIAVPFDAATNTFMPEAAKQVVLNDVETLAATEPIYAEALGAVMAALAKATSDQKLFG